MLISSVEKGLERWKPLVSLELMQTVLPPSDTFLETGTVWRISVFLDAMFLCPLSLCCISLPSGPSLTPLQFVASAAMNVINDSQGHRLLVALCLIRRRSGSDLPVHIIHWLENPSQPPHLPLPLPLCPDCVLLRSEETWLSPPRCMCVSTL